MITDYFVGDKGQAGLPGPIGVDGNPGLPGQKGEKVSTVTVQMPSEISPEMLFYSYIKLMLSSTFLSSTSLVHCEAVH